MTYVVTDACIKCKYMDCVEVCPVDCFYEGEVMLAINPNDATILARLALREAKLGERAAAESHITRALTFGANDAEVLYHSAVVRALAGDIERALDSLEQALKNGYGANAAAADRDLDAIRNTPRFRALVASAGK